VNDDGCRRTLTARKIEGHWDVDAGGFRWRFLNIRYPSSTWHLVQNAFSASPASRKIRKMMWPKSLNR
jgi:hypothetical protein